MPNDQLIAARKKLAEAQKELVHVRAMTQHLSDTLSEHMLSLPFEEQLGFAKIIVDRVKNTRLPLLIEAKEILRNPVRQVQESDPFLGLKTVVVN